MRGRRMILIKLWLTGIIGCAWLFATIAWSVLAFSEPHGVWLLGGPMFVAAEMLALTMISGVLALIWKGIK